MTHLAAFLVILQSGSPAVSQSSFVDQAHIVSWSMAGYTDLPPASSLSAAREVWLKTPSSPVAAKQVVNMVRSIEDYKAVTEEFLKFTDKESTSPAAYYGLLSLYAKICYSPDWDPSVTWQQLRDLAGQSWKTLNSKRRTWEKLAYHKPVLAQVALDIDITYGVAYTDFYAACTSLASKEGKYLNYRMAERMLLGYWTYSAPYGLIAIECLKRLPKSEEKRWQYQYLLGWSHAVQKSPDIAKEILKKALPLIKGDAEAKQRVQRYLVTLDPKTLIPKQRYYRHP